MVKANNFTTVIFKKCVDALSVPLNIIINKSFKGGKIPDTINKSFIYPLYKKGDKNSFMNYRPISCSSTILKIIEMAFYYRLKDFLEDNKIINTNQQAYQKGKNTQNCLGQVIGSICSAMNEGRRVSVFFIDLKAAFDYIIHETLLKKLKNIGFFLTSNL